MATNGRNAMTDSMPSGLERLSDESRDVMEQIYQKAVWETGNYALKPEIGEYDFTKKDAAEAIDEPKHWLHYDWERVENALEEAESENLVSSYTATVDIDRTTGDEVYADVQFYRLLEEPDEPVT